MSEDTLLLSARVSDETGLKDVFVFVNDSKIYYKALSSVEKVDGEFSYGLKVAVPLEPGVNRIVVVSRESEELVTRKGIGVFRDSLNIVAKKQRSKDVSIH